MTFELSSSICFLFACKLGSPQCIFTPPSISSLCTSQVPPNSIPIHLFVLQVHGSQHEVLTHVRMFCKYGKVEFKRLKGVRTSLVQTSCSSFSYKQRECTT
jgi:hypothetical protein